MEERDFDRNLNERGKQDAPQMAQKLLDTNIILDTFISSSAKRARKTAKSFIEAYGKTKNEIILSDDLYNAPSDAFYKTIATLKDEQQAVAIFAHNPGITDFVNTLCDTHIDEMPTCGIYAVQVPITSWKHFEDADKEFLFFKYPKEP